MARKVPTVPVGLTVDPLPNQKRSQAADGRWQNPEDFIVEERTYELITPLFGGGVKPQSIDPITPIRGAGIRGHLRFWWRATRGGQFNGDLDAMRDAEAVIWGAASTEKKPRPAAVTIEVKSVIQGNSIVVFEVKPNKKGKLGVVNIEAQNIPAYAAFPLQPERKKWLEGLKSPPVWDGIIFTLRIQFPIEYKCDVESALWAWETFGGVGGRTRRGFGAIVCRSIGETPNKLPEKGNVREWLITNIEKYVADGTRVREGQLLSKDIQQYRVVVPTNKSATSEYKRAWLTLIEEYRKFRQQRTGGPQQPSDWTEPDAIREIANLRPSGKLKRFPRAWFGLPIIFHFPQDNLSDFTLKGSDRDKVDRLASPLILRPLACENGQSVAIAVVLDSLREPLNGVFITGQDVRRKVINQRVEAKIAVTEIGLISPLGGNSNVLEAFFATLPK